MGEQFAVGFALPHKPPMPKKSVYAVIVRRSSVEGRL
jgi:hypothetical protein